MNNNHARDMDFLKIAIDMARQGISSNRGGPFGAIVVQDDEIIGRGCNQVTSSHDPTAHAEIVAIRHACNNIKSFQLKNCSIYSTCEPCPMCLGAIYWAGLKRVIFSLSRLDAKKIGFQDELIYKELILPHHLRKMETKQIYMDESLEVFNQWFSDSNRIEY
jgi:guanine deaminase